MKVNLIAIGVENLHLPSAQTIETAYNTERDLPPGVDQNRRWKYGEVEFEGLMRRLDNDVSHSVLSVCHSIMYLLSVYVRLSFLFSFMYLLSIYSYQYIYTAPIQYAQFLIYIALHIS